MNGRRRLVPLDDKRTPAHLHKSQLPGPRFPPGKNNFHWHSTLMKQRCHLSPPGLCWHSSVPHERPNLDPAVATSPLRNSSLTIVILLALTSHVTYATSGISQVTWCRFSTTFSSGPQLRKCRETSILSPSITHIRPCFDCGR
jgi:hypothetical protein